MIINTIVRVIMIFLSLFGIVGSIVILKESNNAKSSAFYIVVIILLIVNMIANSYLLIGR